MFVPSEEQILTRQPTFNSFYRAPDSADKLVAQIANVARQNAGLDSTYTFKTVQAMAFSPWNHHIDFSMRGYENYGFEGPQYSKKYSLEPLAPVNSGNHYPVIWIPDPDTPLEPSDLFAPQSIPVAAMPIPDEPFVAPIPDEIIAELADTTRPIIELQPLTQEAQEIALSVPSIPTVEEAVVIQQAVAISENAAAIIENPNATAEQKSQAILEVAELAYSAGIEEEVIEAVTNDALTAVVLQQQQQVEYMPVEELPIPGTIPDQMALTTFGQEEEEKGLDAFGIIAAALTVARFFG